MVNIDALRWDGTWWGALWWDWMSYTMFLQWVLNVNWKFGSMSDFSFLLLLLVFRTEVLPGEMEWVNEALRGDELHNEAPRRGTLRQDWLSFAMSFTMSFNVNWTFWCQSTCWCDQQYNLKMLMSIRFQFHFVQTSIPTWSACSQARSNELCSTMFFAMSYIIMSESRFFGHLFQYGSGTILWNILA